MKINRFSIPTLTGKKLFTWLPGLAAAIAAVGVIVQTLDKRDLEIRVVAQKEETDRLKGELQTLTNQVRQAKEEGESFKSTLARVKAQYDIPDSVIGDILRSTRAKTELSQFKTLTTLNVGDLKEATSFSLARNQTTRVLYPRFTLTISVSDVKPDGKSIMSLGFILPEREIPESLLIELFPSQYTTISSTDKRQLFYVGLLAADPSSKSALVEVKPLDALRKMVISK